MLQILFAVGVTFIVINAVPSATINSIKLLPKAKESILVSARAKLLVNLQSSAHGEEINLFVEPLEKPNLNRTENDSSEHSQTIVPNLLREPIKTSLPLPNEVIGEQHLSKVKKAFVDGQTENLLAKYYINGGISDLLAQTPPPDLLDLRSSESHVKNMDELAKPLQQANVLASPQSPQRLGEENSDDISNREQILVPDPGYQPSKVLGDEFKFTIIPNYFIRLKQDSIVAPPQDYLVELVDKSVAVQKYEYDLPLGEMLVHNILAQQAIDALKQESAAVFKLDSILSSALKYLRPPLDDLRSEQDGMRSSLDLLKESDAEPVKTILYLWESDEYDTLGSEFSQYGEETRTGNDEENDDSNSTMTPNNFKRYQRFKN